MLAVELSSFQLHWSSTVRPLAAAVLNLAPDHLDWHGIFEAYGAGQGQVLDGADGRASATPTTRSAAALLDAARRRAR